MFTKPALTIQQQIAQLQNRGLLINPLDKVEHYLSHISYYRLSGYWWPMQADRVLHTFKLNSKFSNVMELYNFDRELRLLLFDVIKKIEISLRTKLIYHLSHEIGPWWFEDASNFIDRNEHNKTLQTIKAEVNRSKDILLRNTGKNIMMTIGCLPAGKH